MTFQFSKDSNKSQTHSSVVLAVHPVTNLNEKLVDSDNEKYSYELLVQNRIFNNLGLQKEILYGANKVEQISPISLKNNFDYKSFKELNSQVFIKSEVLSPYPIEEHSPTLEKNPPLGSYIFNRLLAVGICALTLWGSLSLSSTINENGKANYTANNIWSIIYTSQLLYSNRTDYAGLTENLLINAGVASNTVQNNKYVTGYNTVINIKPATLTSINDSIGLTLNNISSESCSLLANKLVNINLERVKVNNILVIKNAMIDLSNVNNACNKENNTIIIEQKEPIKL